MCNLWSLKKINKCLFIPNCTRKIMWLRVNNLHGKYEMAYHNWLSISKARASGAKIIYLNRAFVQNNRVRGRLLPRKGEIHFPKKIIPYLFIWNIFALIWYVHSVVFCFGINLLDGSPPLLCSTSMIIIYQFVFILA